MKDKGTYAVQDTSTTLLRDVADTQHARWAVFHSRYEPMMRAFIKSRFPSVDADDVIQVTFVALARAIPHYTYNPKENGHFRNYLTGILRNKALKALARRQRDSFLNEQAAAEIVGGASANEIDYREWRESVYEIALQQLLADESIHERTKQVFVRLAIDGEKPEAVAESLGIPYNTVIRIRKRAIARLRSYVEAMKKA